MADAYAQQAGQVDDISSRLSREYELDGPTVEGIVKERFSQLSAGARIRDFLPVLIEREVRARLRSLSRHRG